MLLEHSFPQILRMTDLHFITLDSKFFDLSTSRNIFILRKLIEKHTACKESSCRKSLPSEIDLMKKFCQIFQN